MENISEELSSSCDSVGAEKVTKSLSRFRSLRRTLSFRKFRRRSEELLTRNLPKSAGVIRDEDNTKVHRLGSVHLSQPQIGSHAVNNNNVNTSFLSNTFSSDEDSPFTNRKWKAIGRDLISGPIKTSSRNSLLGTHRNEVRTSQEEYCYRQVLQSVITPLGAPDQRPGFRPQDLALYTRQLFNKEKKDHEQKIKEVHNNKPSNIVLSVTVVEARDIRPIGSTGLSDPFCLLNVQKSKSQIDNVRSSPKTSPKNSPKSSPKSHRKSGHVPKSASADSECCVLETSTVKSTLYPTWNEQFELDVHSVGSEEIYVSIWDDGSRHDPDTTVCRDMYKSSGIKGLFKNLRHHIDYKITGGLIGHCRMPLKNIPATGCDKWFDLFVDKKRRIKGQGQIRLKLQLSLKQGLDHLDGVESDQCSIEDYHYIVHRVYLHAISTEQDRCTQTTSTGKPTFLQLSEQGRGVLNQFAAQNHFSRISQKLIELVVILGLFVDQQLSVQISEKLLKDCVVNLEMEWHQVKVTNNNDLGHKVVSETEMTLFDRATSTFISHVIEHLKKGDKPIPKLFPPCDLDLDQLNLRISIAVGLSNVHLMTCANQEGSVQKNLANVFMQRLQEDVKSWLENKISLIQSDANEPVIPKMRILVEILQDCLKMATPIYSVSQYFSRLSMDYFKTVSLVIETRLSCEAKSLMLQMDAYQVKYHDYLVNIRESSTVSLQLYMALRGFYNMLRTNISERELFRVSMATYQEWFTSAVTFWLHTFRDECIRRMEKALEVEKDVVQVTSLVKYSNSSVDILSCFYKITTEWQQIAFQDADIAALGVTKITDTICDGVKGYMEKINGILENNGFYDYIDNAQFDVTDQLCITLNNIAHIRDYLTNLPKLLDWESVTESLSQKHESDQVGAQALQALHNLVQCAEDDMFMRGKHLMKRIIDLIGKDLETYTLNFTQCRPDERSSIDDLQDYLQSNLSVLHNKLEPFIFCAFLEEIWASEINIFLSTLLRGQSPEYYSNMLTNLMSLRAFFNMEGVEKTVTDCETYCHLVDTLKLNSLPSLSLMRRVYSDLTSHVATPTLSYGCVTVKFGYFPEPQKPGSEALVTLHVKVTVAKDLPGMLRSEVSDPYVTVSLCPTPMFQQGQEQKTSIKRHTTNPVFNTTFSFSRIEEHLMTMEGTVVVLSVWHHNTILPDDFLGEIILPLSDAPRLEPRQTVEDTSAVMKALQRPPQPHDGPFQVLKERSVLKPQARLLVAQRSLMAGYTPSYACCTPVTYLVSKLKGRKTVLPTRKKSGFELPKTS